MPKKKTKKPAPDTFQEALETLAGGRPAQSSVLRTTTGDPDLAEALKVLRGEPDPHAMPDPFV